MVGRNYGDGKIKTEIPSAENLQPSAFHTAYNAFGAERFVPGAS